MEEVKIIAPQETYQLRLDVLWPHIHSIDECCQDYDNVDSTFHVGAFKGDELVAIGSFMLDELEMFNGNKQYRLRAMATSPKVRGEGYGKKVIEFAINELKKRNVDVLWCNARKIAFGFYKKIGFEITGDYFDIPKIGPHKNMYYRLN